MNAPQLILPGALDKKGYRLRARFKIEPFPRKERLDVEKVRVAERFVHDMHTQGWEYDNRYGFRMRGPFVPVMPKTLRPVRQLSARQMLEGVLRGERFRDQGKDEVSAVLALTEVEYWEYELAAVFVRTQIFTEVPDSHEEIL